MAVDGYQVCPYGTGKKFKFCCKDGAEDFTRLQEVAGKGQWAVLLNQTEALDKKQPGRPCILSERCHAQMALGQFDDAIQSAESLVKLHPQNPSGYALRAEAKVARGESPWEVIDDLQTAQELDGPAPCNLIDPVMMNVARYLAEIGLGASAAMHMHQINRRGNLEEYARREFSEGCRAGVFPPAVRLGLSTVDPPEGVDWEDDYAEAEDQFLLGNWRRAARFGAALAERLPDQPEIFWLLGLCQAALGDERAYETLARVSAAEKADLKLALQAELLRRSVERVSDDNSYRVQLVRFDLKDAEAVRTAVLSNRCFLSRPVNPAAWTTREEVPPELAGVLLDKPMAPGDVPTKAEQLPNAIGNFFFYGKRTDQEAVLSLVGALTPEFSALIAELKGSLGDAVSKVEEKDQDGSRLLRRLHWTRTNALIPPDVPQPQIAGLVEAATRRQYLEVWPAQSWPELDGKKVGDVKNDPRQRRVVWGLVLAQWLADADFARIFDFRSYLEAIQFPAPAAEDLEGLDLESMGLIELSLQPLADAPTELLCRSWVVVERLGLAPLARRIGLEVVGRDPAGMAKEERAIAAMICGTLAESAGDGQDAEARKYLELGRKLPDNPMPEWRWDLLDVRLTFRAAQNVGDVETVLQKYQQQHGRNRQAMETLMAMLQQLGVRIQGAPQPGAPAGRAPAAAAAAPTPSSGIWTPGSASPAPAPAAAPAAEKKSALWIPGRD